MEVLSDRGSTPLASTKPRYLDFQGIGVFSYSRNGFGRLKSKGYLASRKANLAFLLKKCTRICTQGAWIFSTTPCVSLPLP